MKKIITVFLCVLFSLMLFIPVNAETDEGLPRVVDNAGIFTETQFEDLTDRANTVAEKYDIEYLLITCDDLEGMSAQTYATEFPFNNGYCEYGEFEGVILFLSVDPYDKHYYTIAFNSYQNDFSDKVREKINDIIYDDMKSGDYYEGFKQHIKLVGQFYKNGKKLPLKYRIEWDNVWIALIVGAVVGAVVGGMRLSSCKKKMRVVAPVDAHQYLDGGSFNLRDKRTYYLYSTVTKTPRKESSGSSGGSSSGSSSSGSYSSSGRSL